MSSTSSDVDLARTVTGVIAGAVVALVVFAVIVVIYIFRERALYTRINEQAAKVEAMNKLMETRLKLGGTQFESLEDLLKPYKKHLLQSAYDLQSRLSGQLTGNTIFTFKHTRKEQDGAYMVDSTIYFFAEFLGWMEVIRSKIVFITGSAYAEALNALFDSIRFMFTGESSFQGCEEKNHDILQLFIVDIRSIGNAMLTTVDGFHRPITVDVFLRRLSKAAEKIKKTKEQEAAANESLKRSARISTGDAFDLGNDRRHFASAAGTSDPLDMEERVDVIAFQKIIEPLKSHINRLADLCGKAQFVKFKEDKKINKGSEFESKEWDEEMTPPTKRLAILQVLLNRLISILDDAVPWDAGPKFDPNEEPQYIQRSMLITPQVKFLSETQKGYLRDQLYFKDDPNFSFRGFREDLNSKPQAYRDKEFWPGAFPPMEPRSRPEYFKRNLPSIGNGSDGSVTTALSHNTQGLATAGAQQRARARRRKALKDAKDDFPLNDDPDDPNRDKPRAAKTILDSAAAAVGATIAAAVAPRSSNRVAPEHRVVPEHSASALKKRAGAESGRVGSVSFQADQQGFMVSRILAGIAGQEASSSAAGPSSQAVRLSPLGRAEARLRPSPDAPPQQYNMQDPSFASYIHPPSLPPSSVNVSAGITAGVHVEEGASPSVGQGVTSPTRTRLPPLGQKRGEHLV